MSMKIDGSYNYYKPDHAGQYNEAGEKMGQPEKGTSQPKVRSDVPDKSAEKCTVNTDKVDREIETLRKKVQQLEQQVRSASGDEKKVKELALAQAKSELSQKANDTYRRQHSSVSV